MNTNALEELARIEDGDRSLRIERSRFDSPHGPRTVLLITTYRRVRGGRWCRVGSVGVRRKEMVRLAAALHALALPVAT